MPHQPFISALKGVFVEHGRPEPQDQQAAILHLLVLNLEGMEALLSTVQDLKSALNDQSAKLSQLEADTGALIAKVGSGSSTPPGDVGLTQGDLDTLVSQVTSNNGRIDTLVTNVVAGTTPTVQPTPSGETPAPAVATPTPAPASPATPPTT